MNSRDLVKASLSHKQGERVPYCIMFTPEGREKLKSAIGDKDLDTFVDNDISTVSVPWWIWHELGTEWKMMEPPLSRATVVGSGNYEESIDNIKRIHDESGKYVLVLIWGSHFEKANDARSIENFLADMAGEPEFAKKLLDRIIEKNMVMLENILAIDEIDGVLLGSDWGTQLDLIMSPDIWNEMIRPGEQREYDLIHSYGKDVWLHSCGNIELLIPSLIEMGVDALNPIQPEAMDIRMLKEKYGDKLTFWGGVSTQQILPFGTPEEVKVEARQTKDIMSQAGGYIFAPGQDIQGDVPAENILALIEVAKEGR